MRVLSQMIPILVVALVVAGCGLRPESGAKKDVIDQRQVVLQVKGMH